jgi:hypothetical protein
MSFKSREKKRRARIAISKSRIEHREAIAGRYYLTIVSRTCSCNRCGDRLREGRECVYRHTPREILCLGCANLGKIRYRTSVKWERSKAKGQVAARSSSCRAIGTS